MAEAKTLLTAEQFYAMSAPDLRAELVDGEIVPMVAPGFEHGFVAMRIGGEMRNYVEPAGLGAVVSEVGFILSRDPDRVRVPDVAFISQQKVAATGRTRKFWPAAPDLAVEVLSPDDRATAVLGKVGDYLEAGTRLVWIVDAVNQRITAYRGIHDVRVYGPDDTLSGEDVIPGFALKVSRIFE